MKGAKVKTKNGFYKTHNLNKKNPTKPLTIHRFTLGGGLGRAHGLSWGTAPLYSAHRPMGRSLRGTVYPCF